MGKYPPYSHEYFMNEALKEARMAFQKDEVPVGAVVVCENRIIARAYNLTETLRDVTAHAEMQVFTAACDHFGGKYLEESTLYVTIEPCVMCAGAAFWTRIGTIVFGAKDEKRGFSLVNHPLLHPKTKIEGGVLEEEASRLMKDFFNQKRT
jgi:tRNA(adenine34) deaminase